MRHTTTVEAPPLLTISEVASALRVSYETIRRRVSDGTIHSVTLGRVIRVPASELDRLLDDVSATRRP
ncbi:MAG TPA: helix-turn-helix domain-containing protein [Gaiellaceae bacterium]|nr:helix-turn-helix domain-containing protein [Gaiellaceae bacterium]